MSGCYDTPVADRKKANRGPLAGPENRRAIVTAAREVFAERGADAPLSAIARRAGVGQGSLYRHFPDRTAIVAAVFDENIGELERLVDDADAGIAALFDGAAAQAADSVALYETAIAHRRDARLAHLETRLHALAETLLDRDRRRGAVRDGVEVADVLIGVAMAAAVVTAADGADQSAVRSRVRSLFEHAFGRPS